MKEEMGYTHTNEITCPYCGCINTDSWEVGRDVNEGDLGEQECDVCGNKFTVSRNMSITYNSYPAPCLNGEQEHDFRQIVGVPKEYFKGKFRCYICGKVEQRKNE